MRTPNEPFPFFFGADWELEGQQRSLPKSTWNKLLPPKAAYSFISFEMRWQRGRGAICAAEGSVNEHFHTSRSVKKRREERDSRGGRRRRRRKGEQTESRWRKIRQRLRTGKKKKRTQAREGGRECETKKPWGVEVVVVVGGDGRGCFRKHKVSQP